MSTAYCDLIILKVSSAIDYFLKSFLNWQHSGNMSETNVLKRLCKAASTGLKYEENIIS